MGIRHWHWDQLIEYSEPASRFTNWNSIASDKIYAGKINSNNRVYSMEAGFLNHLITPYNGLLIKKTTVNRKLEIRIPKFVLNSDNPGSN